jgi:hypothetical protein
MEEAMIRDHLALAERHVAEGERHIAEQRVRLDELERAGADTTTAKEVLRVFQDSQALHLTDRARLRAELERARPARGHW